MPQLNSEIGPARFVPDQTAIFRDLMTAGASPAIVEPSDALIRYIDDTGLLEQQLINQQQSFTAPTTWGTQFDAAAPSVQSQGAAFPYRAEMTTGLYGIEPLNLTARAYSVGPLNVIADVVVSGPHAPTSISSRALRTYRRPAR